MKTARFFTCLIVIMLVFTAWTPSTAYALGNPSAPAISTNSPSQGAKAPVSKMVKMTVFNKTGGPLYVTLQGILNGQSYFFYVGNPGKTTFLILSGKYQFTVVGCGGASYSRNRNFKGGGTIGPMVCLRR